MRMPLTKQLLTSLKQQGYTHIQQRGIESKPGSTIHTEEYPDDNCILVPWKKDILSFEEANLQLLEIDSADVSDMLDVEFGIRFYVELPNSFIAPPDY